MSTDRSSGCTASVLHRPDPGGGNEPGIALVLERACRLAPAWS